MYVILKMNRDSRLITLVELNTFENYVRHSLPKDYRQHMLAHNGFVVQQRVNHINYPDGGKGIAKFYPVRYGSDTMEDIFNDLSGIIPAGYLSIGKTRDQGQILLSLNNDSTYGNIVEWFPDGEINALSPSFTHLINDMVESQD